MSQLEGYRPPTLDELVGDFPSRQLQRRLNELTLKRLQLQETLGRPNGQCPCGSGLKYKRCCLKADRKGKKDASRP